MSKRIRQRTSLASYTAKLGLLCSVSLLSACLSVRVIDDADWVSEVIGTTTNDVDLVLCVPDWHPSNGRDMPSLRVEVAPDCRLGEPVTHVPEGSELVLYQVLHVKRFNYLTSSSVYAVGEVESSGTKQTFYTNVGGGIYGDAPPIRLSQPFWIVRQRSDVDVNVHNEAKTGSAMSPTSDLQSCADSRALITQVAPAYPNHSKIDEGWVRVALEIAPDGRVVNANATDWTSKSFVHSALRAVRQWEYEPAAETCAKSVLVAFELTDDR
ncbi:MAG: energy transducer TonB [Pseudomonadota bacterium]